MRGVSRVGSPVRQTIFCGRRFCPETLGCPFRCFGRPWRFLLGTIQYSVRVRLYDLEAPNNLLYTVLYTVHYILQSVYYIL